jgi:hypothetical protein
VLKTSPPSKRVRQLHAALVKAVPRFPNVQASKAALEAKSLGSLFVSYFNWRMRFVAPLARTVTIRPDVTQDPRWRSLSASIQPFLQKVAQGDDLTPHLSLGARREGYTPASERQGAGPERWADKDFLLNAMGFHHFHLGTQLETGGFVTRTDDVLFAHVSRDTFTVFGLFDHSVFVQDTTNGMTPERQRLWALHESFLGEGLPPGAVVVGGMLAMSGHSTYIVLHAQACAKLIKKIDLQLDNSAYLRANLYGANGIAFPSKRKLRWALKHLDLYLCDDANQLAFLIRRGPY